MKETVVETSVWLLLISNWVVPGCCRSYVVGGLLIPPTLDDLLGVIRQEAYDEGSELLRRVAEMSEDDIIAIRNAVFEASRPEVVLGLPCALYYHDADADADLGARIRRAGMRALETSYANWRCR